MPSILQHISCHDKARSCQKCRQIQLLPRIGEEGRIAGPVQGVPFGNNRCVRLSAQSISLYDFIACIQLSVHLGKIVAAHHIVCVKYRNRIKRVPCIMEQNRHSPVQDCALSGCRPAFSLIDRDKRIFSSDRRGPVRTVIRKQINMQVIRRIIRSPDALQEARKSGFLISCTDHNGKAIYFPYQRKVLFPSCKAKHRNHPDPENREHQNKLQHRANLYQQRKFRNCSHLRLQLCQKYQPGISHHYPLLHVSCMSCLYVPRFVINNE